MTVCERLQVPLEPPVKVSVAVLPARPAGPLTVTSSRSPAGTVTVSVTVTPVPGSVLRRTPYVPLAAAPPCSVSVSAVFDSTRPVPSSSLTVTDAARDAAARLGKYCPAVDGGRSVTVTSPSGSMRESPTVGTV